MVGQGRYIQGGYTSGSQVGATTYTTGQNVQYVSGGSRAQQVSSSYVPAGGYQTTTTTYQTGGGQYQAGGSQYQTGGSQYQTGGSQVAYQMGQNAVQSGTYSSGGQHFVSGAPTSGANYTYTSGGVAETGAYTTGGYVQPGNVNTKFTTVDGDYHYNTGGYTGSQ